MHERRNKLTLEQIRTLFPFEVPTLAERAGVSSETLYFALQLSPIRKKDAEQITSKLSVFNQLGEETQWTIFPPITENGPHSESPCDLFP